jgi:hypothetical protein
MPVTCQDFVFGWEREMGKRERKKERKKERKMRNCKCVEKGLE